MKIRILIFSIAYHPLIGGAELAVKNITDRLSRSSALGRDESSFEFDVITARFSRSHPVRERIDNVNVYRVGFGGRIGRYLYPIFAFRLAAKLHRESPYQIVWAIMAAYGAAAAMLFKRKFPEVKYLLTLQEGDAVQNIHKKVRGFKGIWQKSFQKADYIQAISNHLANWARAEGAKCPVEVVPNGVDLNRIKYHVSSIEDDKKIVIISASRLVSKNGMDILIRATAELKGLIHNTEYLIQILGSGPEGIRLKKLVKDLAIEDQVEFLGSVENDKVPEYLMRADIFVRPSRSEGQGIAFLEAMAAGLPVIGTPVGGIPEFVHDGDTGLLAKPEDFSDLAAKIQRLILDEPLREKLGQNGRKLVEQKYDWNVIAEKMNDVIRNLIRPSATLSDIGEG
jgi:glycosyltransferase involved in cell wall biosynthesis